MIARWLAQMNQRERILALVVGAFSFSSSICDLEHAVRDER